MAISKIQYDDKVAINIDSTIPDINKCNASDLNEIKSVVNNNADETPTKTSDLTNDSGYITKDVNDLTNYTKTSDLSSVATSGSYNDLIDTPTIPTMSDEYGTSTTEGYSQNYINTNTLNPSGEPSTSEEDVSSATFNNTLEAPMNIDLKGNTLQNGTPTPSSPIPINNVSGDNQIVVSNGDSDTTTYNIDLPVENKFNIGTSTTTQLAITRTYSNSEITLDGTCSGNGYLIDNNSVVATLPKGTYIMKVNIVSGTISNSNEAFVIKKIVGGTGTNLKQFSLYQKTSEETQITLDETSDIAIAYWVNSGVKYENFKIQIQLEKGLKSNKYTPFGTTPIELCKIGTYQDYIYKENDKWYLHKEIGKVVLDGSETYTTSSVSGYRRFTTTISDALSVSGRTEIISNYFKYSNDMNNVGVCFLNNASAYLYPNTDITSIDNFKTWLASNNTIVEYPLATPTNTEITYTPLINQLESIKNAMSKEGTTNINQVNNDAPFILDLSVFNDTYNGRYQSVLEMYKRLSNQ